MKRLHLFGLALAVVFAFTTVAATVAMAEELIWLVEGNPVLEDLKAETEGELELFTLSAAGVRLNNILCPEGVFDGLIGIKGEDTVTTVLNEAMEEILLGVRALECKVEFDEGALADCKAAENALVWPANLPWETQLELMPGATEEWLDHFFGSVAGNEPGFEVECKTLTGITATDTCTGLSSAWILAVLEQSLGVGAFGAHGEFTSNSEEGTCAVSGAPSGQIGLGVTWAIGIELERLETDASEV